MKVEQTDAYNVTLFRRSVDGREPRSYDPSQVTGDVPFSPGVIAEATYLRRAGLAPVRPAPVAPKA